MKRSRATRQRGAQHLLRERERLLGQLRENELKRKVMEQEIARRQANLTKEGGRG